MRLNLSVVRFEVNVPELRAVVEAFAKNRVQAFETLVWEARKSVSDVLSQAMNAEMTLFLGRPEESGNKRNGFEERDYTLKGVGTLRVKVPVDRKRKFSSVIIPKSERIDPRLKEDLAALHIAGLSTRTLAMMSKRVLGLDVSHQTVSSSLELISDAANKWLTRPLQEPFWGLIVDGTYFHVRRRGSVEKEPSLVVLGITADNRRSILAIEPGTRDSADCWRAVFKSLKDRGLDPREVKVGIMDGLPGLESAFLEAFPQALTCRCWFHAMSNALAKVPKRLREPFHVLAKRVMYADGEAAALIAFEDLKIAMGADAKRAIDCLDKDIDSLVSHYKFPRKLWRSLKTTNAVERIHKEVKRRSRAMEAMGETTLTSLLAFTSLRLEMAWRRRAIDTYTTRRIENIMPSLIQGSEAGSAGETVH